MDLRLFGGFQLFDDVGTPVEITARKSKALLAWLALHPDTHQSRERLSLLLWEESNEAQARHSLRQALSGLRKALGEHVRALATDQESVYLRTDHIQVDALRFDQLLGNQTNEALINAVSLYHGDFLEAFNPRSEGYEEWLMLQRSHYRESARVAMSRLLAHFLESAQWESGVRLAIRLLSSDPLQEQVHRILMQLYVRLNQPAEALRQYRQCRRVLFRELNIAPEPETARLFEEIRQSRSHPEPDGTIPLTPITSNAVITPSDRESADTALPTSNPTQMTLQLRPVTVAHLHLSHYRRPLQ